jgi:hypothetical protein
VGFGVQSPPKVDGVEAYPLVVVLNGGPRVPPGETFPHFQVRPSRNGIWGYRSMSTYDAMQVVALMKWNYPIDPNRVYLVGSSAGGSGAMHLASCFPDEFAAVIPLIAAGNNYPLVNFTNLPIAFHHGDRDWVSSVCNVRVQTQRLQTLGCPTFLKEYPGAGHGVPGPHEPMMEWLFEQRRNPAPKTIRHECEAPSLGRSYWLRIQEFADPHQRAYVEAEIGDGIATIRPKNIAALSLTLDLIGLGLFHPNPKHPERLVYILAPFTDEAGLALFRANAQYFLPGSDGFDRISQPDLVVQDLQHRIARQMQFDKDWQWLSLPGADTPIPSRFTDRANLAITSMNVMLGKSHADFALWWGPADKGMWGTDFNHLQRFDPASYTLADFRTQHRMTETTLGSVTGAELKEIWLRWGQTEELLSVPMVDLDKLDDAATYRLHILMDLYIKLGQRQKNLGDPKPGPAFTPDELIPHVFEQN